MRAEITQARESDLDSIRDIHAAARRAAMPWLPVIHSPEEDLRYFTNIVFRTETLMVARDAGEVVGYSSFSKGWLTHLYVAPIHWRRGIATALLTAIKAKSPALNLWTFQQNEAARRFYQAQGFIEHERTDGQGNEEQTPDIRMEWRSL